MITCKLQTIAILWHLISNSISSVYVFCVGIYGKWMADKQLVTNIILGWLFWITKENIS